MTPEHRLAIQIMHECGRSPHEIIADDCWPRGSAPKLSEVEDIVWEIEDMGKVLKSNRFLTAEGQTRTLSEWARIKGIRPCTITKRLDKGLSPEEALNKPLRITSRTRRYAA